MAYCIECGAKAPDIAKFCPQCGAALVQIEETSAVAEITPDVDMSQDKTLVEIETEQVPEVEADTLAANEDLAEPEKASIDSAPSPADSIATAADVVADQPKSKAGLFIGLALLGLIAVGGGAYASGLLWGNDNYTETETNVSTENSPAASPNIKTQETVSPNTDPVLAAYQDAIKTGRISDLGQFAKDNPASSLAKDAEDAAFASLQRQSSGLAYITFIQYFPETDMAAYLGPRINDNVNTDTTDVSSEPVFVELNEAALDTPSIRYAITQRAAELEPFIEQGNADYALSVIDEMAVMAGLTDQEAVFLLNLSERAESARILAAPAQDEIIPFDLVKPDPVAAIPVDTTPVDEMPEPIVETQTCWDGREIDATAACPSQPEAYTCWNGKIVYDATTCPPTPGAESAAPTYEPAFDTAAKPLERFGAETPEAATKPGECDLVFSIDTNGTPIDISSVCTDPLFTRPAEKTVSEWTYSPALLEGAPVQQEGVTVKMKFHLE